MCVPQIIGAEACACSCAAHNRLPHISRGIDAYTFAVEFDSVDDFSQKVAIASVVSTPAAACAGVGLHINPNLAVKISINASNHLVDLCSPRLSPAREHVDIRCKASCLGVVEVLDDVGIDCAIGAVASDHEEAVAVVFDTGVGGGGIELAHVDTQCAESGND